MTQTGRFVHRRDDEGALFHVEDRKGSYVRLRRAVRRGHRIDVVAEAPVLPLRHVRDYAEVVVPPDPAEVERARLAAAEVVREARLDGILNRLPPEDAAFLRDLLDSRHGPALA